MKWCAAIMALLATPVAAQVAVPCDWAARADALVEPWSAHTKTFANNEVRLALLDTVEPALGAFHLLLISPPYNELGARQCRTLGLTEHTGFTNIDFSTLSADYDPAIGLIFRLAVEIPDGQNPAARALTVTLNQSTGAVQATLDQP